MSIEFTELVTNSEFNQNQLEEVEMLSSVDLVTVSGHMLDHFELLNLGTQAQPHAYTIDFDQTEIENLKELYNFGLNHLKMGAPNDKQELPADRAIAFAAKGEPTTVNSAVAKGPMQQIQVQATLSVDQLKTLHKALVHFVSNHSRTVDNDTQRRLEATAQYLEDNYTFVIADWDRIRRKI